ncbi:MAG TPA: SDR family NAD(P)-dependent oxidoreductase [Acetobacteraceae bacterium]
MAIITGAGSGMGRAHAVKLASLGARVVVQDIDKDGAAETVRRITEDGGQALAVVSDIADCATHAPMAASAASAFGRIDILVNNAGIGLDRPLEAIDEAALDRMLGVHVKGTFFATQAVLPYLKRVGAGRIVNVSSRWAMAGHHLASDYIAAKGAILGLTKAWAKELAPHAITVNALAPGGVWSAMVLQTIGEAGVREEASQVPLQRWAQPEELAETVAFLVSDEASFITGQVIAPNGGKTVVGF